MLQMKFKPRFIEAFRSGQKITSLRMMDFRCRCYDGHDYPPVYIHSDTLKYRTHVDTAEVFDLSLPAGLAVKYTSDLAGLLKRQPYQQGDDIELVAVYDSGEIAPFATATIGDISVIKGDRIEDIDAIHDGFNPDRDPLAELLAFMRNIYPTKDPLNEMYWLYTFTNIQMLPMWGGAA
ncbi:hypothetical protein A4N44_20980 [Salmonella enterica subsp. enterica serovar Typhimurium]|nr:hypothetical protein [Salmonella enterica subsp. enterica serovar Typhimurium]EEI9431171.1 hypothetical protein [Salmonella enterica subsp. diarizonae]EFT5968013.1 hypothetical protein [Salmonella enterica]EGQ4787526.1 hypothetical protein [Salmonella enterica subsp. enterica serovar Durban]EDA9136311.1 hypothetical protein [Salmonella enterica subsp. enterica serovar Typhimurium]